MTEQVVLAKGKLVKELRVLDLSLHFGNQVTEFSVWLLFSSLPHELT